MKQKARIIGTGSYVPPKRLTNADLERMLDTSDEWIYSHTGIRERRIADDNTSTSDMAVENRRYVHLGLSNAFHCLCDSGEVEPAECCSV
jgi:hypothetical protein